MVDLLRETLSACAYQVFFDGEPVAGFADFGGLESFPSLDSACQVSLHRGVIVTQPFFNWVMDHSAPSNLHLVQFDEVGRELRSWEFRSARVTRVTASTFTGTGMPFRIEALDLAVGQVVFTEKP